MPKIVTMDKVIEDLKVEYERVKCISYIKDPIAYALYNIWRKAENGKYEQDH